MQLDEICQRVLYAAETNRPIKIVGGGTQFFGEALSEGDELCVADYTGVVDYRPEELMIRVRAGTPLRELTSLLAEHNQMLGFEPPIMGEKGTIGGAVATARAGSRRPYQGAVKDAVLGIGLILQTGEYAEFGGQVMKNVAGYDVSRLCCGALGMLGVIADVSLKLLPRPLVESGCKIPLNESEARLFLQQIQRTASSALSAAAYTDGALHLRFSGDEQAVTKGLRDVSGDSLDNNFWRQLDSLKHPQLEAANEIWRFSTDPAVSSSESFALQDWGFGQRWLTDPEYDPRASGQHQGHWTRIKTGNRASGLPRFEPLAPALYQLHGKLKTAFDAAGIFNPSVMYEGL